MWSKFLKWLDNQISSMLFYSQLEGTPDWKYIARLFLLAFVIPIWLLYIVVTLIGNLLR